MEAASAPFDPEKTLSSLVMMVEALELEAVPDIRDNCHPRSL